MKEKREGKYGNQSAKSKYFNPFEGRDSEEVWQEIRKKGTSLTRNEMIEQIRVAAIEQKRKNKSS